MLGATYYKINVLLPCLKRVRKCEQAREEMVKDVNGQILRYGVEVRRRWAQYFEQVMNVADVREAYINVVGNWRMPVLRDLNERATSLEEEGKAVNEMKSGKHPGQWMDFWWMFKELWYGSVGMPVGLLN